MKAITLWQPWASLVAVGAKTIETRSWSTKYRGPLAIHAAKRKPDVEMLEDGWAGEIFTNDDGLDDSCLAQWFETSEEDYIPERLPAPEDRWSLTLAPDHMPVPMPLGKIVATCELVACVPMVDDIPAQPWSEPWDVVTLNPWPIRTWWIGFGSADSRYVGDQLPYGDFRAGRFAWLLDNIVPADEPIPAKGAQGLWEWKPSDVTRRVEALRVRVGE